MTDIRERVASLLLPELQSGKLEWYYISVARPGKFDSGWLIKARGPTEAWCILHRIYKMPEGCNTDTTGPLPDDFAAKVPAGLLWSKLTETEAKNLGKVPDEAWNAFHKAQESCRGKLGFDARVWAAAAEKNLLLAHSRGI